MSQGHNEESGGHSESQLGNGRNLVVGDTPFSWEEQRLGGHSYKSEKHYLWLNQESWARTHHGRMAAVVEVVGNSDSEIKPQNLATFC